MQYQRGGRRQQFMQSTAWTAETIEKIQGGQIKLAPTGRAYDAPKGQGNVLRSRPRKKG